MPYRHQVAGKQRHDADDRQEARDPKHRGIRSVTKRPEGLVPIAIGAGTAGVGIIGLGTIGLGVIKQPLRWPGGCWFAC